MSVTFSHTLDAIGKRKLAGSSIKFNIPLGNGKTNDLQRKKCLRVSYKAVTILCPSHLGPKVHAHIQGKDHCVHREHPGCGLPPTST